MNEMYCTVIIVQFKSFWLCIQMEFLLYCRLHTWDETSYTTGDHMIEFYIIIIAINTPILFFQGMGWSRARAGRTKSE